MSSIYECSFVSDFIRLHKFISLYTIIIINCAIKHGFVPINTSMCGSTKSCWQQSSGCTASSCQTFVSLQLNGSFLVIEMIGQTSGGNNPNINMAFANDQMMVSSIGLLTSVRHLWDCDCFTAFNFLSIRVALIRWLVYPPEMQWIY